MTASTLAAPGRPASPGLAVLVVGFGTAVAMWAVGYLTHLRPGLVHGSLVLVALLAVQLLGGRVLGRRTGLGWRHGALAGAVTATVNLLILGSLLTDEQGAVVPSLLLWVPGAFVASAGLGAIGAALGARGHDPAVTLDGDDWRHRFALVAAASTLLVVVAGGLVTSTETGLAVPDWPNTYGANMFLYPLSRMTGGIYYEHAHRLYGALTGLSILVLAVLLWRGEARRWVKLVGGVALVAVITQGIVGGMRVTGRPTLSMEAADLAPSLGFAMFHGVFGQLVFVTVVGLAAVTSPRWRAAERSETAPGGGDWSLLAVVLGLLVAQLALGALYRHTYTVEQKMPWAAHAHLTLAAIAVVAVAIVGFRAWARAETHGPAIGRSGLAMLLLLGLQVLLGVGALVAILARTGDPYPTEILLATAHQANGALLLAATALATLWSWRLAAEGTDEAASSPSPVSPNAA